MHVLIDARPLARGGRSGIPLYTKEVISRLITHTKDRFSIYYPGLRNKPLPKDWLTMSHISYMQPTVPGRLLDLSYYFFNKPLVTKGSEADIVYSPHLNSIATGTTPRILTVHDISFLHYPYLLSVKQRYWHALQKWKQQITEATHIIAVSDYTKQDLIDSLHVKAERISVIHPGVDPAFMPLDIHDKKLMAFTKRHELTAPYILHLGALEARKNVSVIIAAFDLLRTNPRFKDFELVLAGAPGYGSGAILDESRKSRSSKNIRILTGIADEERVLLYNGATAFVYTSFFEGFGFPPLEAQACGIPTVISSRTSLSEVSAASTIQVNPWKPAELADALSMLVVDGAKRIELRAVGIQNAKRFSWKDASESIYRVLSAHTLA